MVKMQRRFWLAGLLAAGLLAGCATPPPAPPEARAALAPTGKLRVAVYAGSPTSLVVASGGQRVGVAYELGQELARRLGVPFEAVELRRPADIIEALKKGEVDLTFTNATEARAREVDFTPAMLSVELGYLVPAGGKLKSGADVDRAGVKVGVSQGSTSQGVLTRTYKQAEVVPVASLKVAAEQLQQGRIDAFATNKAILHELADTVPGARILEGRWGLENMAIAIPKGRQAGMSYLGSFAQTVQRDGSLQAIVSRAGLRGTIEPGSR